MVTCAKFLGSATTTPGVVVAFDVVSRSSGHTDHIIKVREYAAVESIRRYVILESTNVGLTIFERASGDAAWTATTLTDAEEMLRLPEIGIEIPVAELYQRVEFDAANDATG